MQARQCNNHKPKTFSIACTKDGRKALHPPLHPTRLTLRCAASAPWAQDGIPGHKTLQDLDQSWALDSAAGIDDEAGGVRACWHSINPQTALPARQLKPAQPRDAHVGEVGSSVHIVCPNHCAW